MLKKGEITGRFQQMTYHSKADSLILLSGEKFLALLRPLRGRSLAAATFLYFLRPERGVCRTLLRINTLRGQKKYAKFGLFLT